MQCSLCGGPVRRNNKTGICGQTYECLRARNRLAEAKWRESNREKKREDGRKNARKYRLKARYGLSIESYHALLVSQSGRCAVCRSPFEGEICVDHDHACCPGEKSCGKCVRGLLCHNCNHILGKAGDSLEVLRSAISYLEGTSCGSTLSTC